MNEEKENESLDIAESKWPGLGEGQGERAKGGFQHVLQCLQAS